ncbi:accessory Sec system translocase SecA2 [Macrococcoides goetzii]|uniref:Protein translocase subunit SecA n=1 Tax=Macrococcoides goetzii TaxID=1891097 RepID=A0A2G5NVN0_9STAP|nr:accessory Sec system translocase SecA2 [Macrococcus goetzii]RAI78916.1 accessory Sec system translocase SecA2 [Macrococcus goetzii]
MKGIINRTINKTRLRILERTLKEINRYSTSYEALSDQALKEKTAEFKARIAQGATLDEILPESYAVVREASRRVLGMYPKEVQLMGAIVMHQGNIAEMQTGEGKTLTATMPLYLNGLTGKGAYLITTNDYLARRDYEEMKPLYEWLGLTASLGFVDLPGYEYKKGEKKKLYDADIIYSTNGRIGFDFLIDNLADQLNGKFLKPFNFGIIDEIDSIILDAAQTPLVISGAPRVQSNLFNVVKELIDTLEEDVHFILNKTKQEVYLTPLGTEICNRYFDIPHMYAKGHTALVRNINLALRAKYLFDLNIDYYVSDGEIMLIDRISGRLLPGTKLQSGLHQSIEAKERVEISDDMSVMATITFQNLFQQFKSFSGMSATSKLGEKEFFDLYGKVVVQIPTDKPVERKDEDDNIFLDKAQKHYAMLHDVKAIHETQRPVLLITRTAEDAEYFSSELFKQGIPNNLLIAQNVAKEAQMIAEAGQLSSVTVATSMAGRGTDIKLGAGVKELGGLAVLISEHMENSRIDRQLRGRAGRQGDPGSSRIYISLEDYLVKRWSDNKMLKNEHLLNMSHEQIEESRLLMRRIAKIVEKAQIVSEEHGMIARQMNNEFEQSVSKQRSMIYDERNRILHTTVFEGFNFEQLAREVFTRAVAQYDRLTEREIKQYIYKHISFQYEGDIDKELLADKDMLVEFYVKLFMKAMQEQQQQFKSDYFYIQYLQKTFLKAIDNNWIQQVDFLQQLRTSINNRQMGRRNAIFEYHRTALIAYEEMGHRIKMDIVRNLALSMITYDKDGNLVVHFP